MRVSEKADLNPLLKTSIIRFKIETCHVTPEVSPRYLGVYLVLNIDVT